jgi:hypothetical protein
MDKAMETFCMITKKQNRDLNLKVKRKEFNSTARIRNNESQMRISMDIHKAINEEKCQI